MGEGVQNDRIEQASEALKKAYDGLAGPICLTEGDNHFYTDPEVAARHAEHIIALFSLNATAISPLIKSDLSPSKIDQSVRARRGQEGELYSRNFTYYVMEKKNKSVASAVLCTPLPHDGIRITISATSEHHRGLYIQQRLVEYSLRGVAYATVWPWRADIIRRQHIPFDAWLPSHRDTYEPLYDKVQGCLNNRPVQFTESDIRTLGSLIRLHELYKMLGFEAVLDKEGERGTATQEDPISYLYRRQFSALTHQESSETKGFHPGIISRAQFEEEFSDDRNGRVPEIIDFGLVLDSEGERRMESIYQYLRNTHAIDAKAPLQALAQVRNYPFGSSLL